MKNNEKLVKALRCCDEYAFCNDCPIFETCDGDVDKAMAIAADAIEALQAELEKKRTADCFGCKCEKLEPKRGEWIEENRRPRSSQFVCSECHRTAYDPQPTRDKAWKKRCRYAYCPNCGAKMEVQE